MYYDLEGIQGYLASVGLFKEIASSVGYVTNCWYTPDGYDPVAKRMKWKANPSALMCYIGYRATAFSPTGEDLGIQHVTGDIFIRRSKFRGDLLLSPASTAMFNMCRNSSDNNNSAFQSLVHEIGHALGIGGGPNGHSVDEVVIRERSGAIRVVTYGVASVVNYTSEPDCAPHPADIMALYALYQRR